MNSWPTSGLFIIVAVHVCAGCGAAGRQVRSVETVTMEPVRVTARQAGDGDVELDAYDARDLLRRGNSALASGACEDAIELYDRLVEEFPDSRYAPAAHYNAALCFEREGRHEAAASRYLTLVRDRPRSEDVRDALFQAARSYERLERWVQVVEVLEQVLARSDLSPDETVEAMSRRGSALVRLARFEEGESQLRRAVSFFRTANADAIRTDYYIAQAQYYLGEVPRIQMGAVALTSDESQFRQALEQRCELLLRAQTQYVQAIRVGNAHWGAASAYRIGEMYSSLFDDVMAVPIGDIEVPPDLTSPEEIRAFLDEFPRQYRRLLRQRLEPLLHNAIRWWESNLMMVERTGLSGEWVEQTSEHLERVRALLEEIEMEEDQEGESSGRSDPSDAVSSAETE